MPGVERANHCIKWRRRCDFDCAHLEVPLDYTNSSSVPLELSLFKVNATQEPKLGSVLINFGGPGGTGAQNLPVLAAQMAVNIGPQWDLVSWDPEVLGKPFPSIAESIRQSCWQPQQTAKTNVVSRNWPVETSQTISWTLAGIWLEHKQTHATIP